MRISLQVFYFSFLLLPFVGKGQAECFSSYSGLQDEHSIFLYHPIYQLEKERILYMSGTSETVYKYYYNSEGFIERSIDSFDSTPDTVSYQIFYNAGSKIDSLITFRYSDIDEDIYSYAGNNNAIQLLQFHQGINSDSLLLTEKYIYGYDQNNRMTLRVDSDWLNADTGAITHYTDSIIYKYNATGKLLLKQRSWISMGYQGMEKTDYLYDSSLLASTKFYYFNPSDSTWLLNEKKDYTYTNDLGFLQKIIVRTFYNAPDSTIGNIYDSTFATYDSLNRIVDSVLIGTLYSHSMHFEYDTAGNIIHIYLEFTVPNVYVPCIREYFRTWNKVNYTGIPLVSPPKFSLIILPNPSSSNIECLFNLKNNGKSVELLISDVYGKEVIRKEIYANGNSLSVDISGFNPGLYFCTLMENGLKIASEKFAVVR